jgi:vanillate O-demethylase monooxygenase subunit
MWLEVGMTMPGAQRSEAPGDPMINPHIVTPEIEESSHYFYTSLPGPENEAFTDRIFSAEDKPMLEAIQRSMDGRDFWSMKPAILSVDAGALRARARLKKLREHECEPKKEEESVHA